ncbi:hypothetical protein ACKKBF_B21480 [Auxenochlorella protothecoides x Auxenochlorella symbiontica]
MDAGVDLNKDHGEPPRDAAPPLEPSLTETMRQPKPAKKPAFGKPILLAKKTPFNGVDTTAAPSPTEEPEPLGEVNSGGDMPPPPRREPLVNKKRILARAAPASRSVTGTDATAGGLASPNEKVLGSAADKPGKHAASTGSSHKVVKTAYQLFCEELRPTLVAENPKASMPELSRLLASAWRATSVEDKAAYAAMRADLMAAAGDPAISGIPATAEGRKELKKRVRSEGGKQASKTKDEAASDGESEKPCPPPSSKRLRAAAATEAHDSGEETEDDDKLRMECDWTKHPAAFIISENVKKGHYLVARKGLPLTDYGVVCSRTAKLQRMAESGTNTACPVSLSMVEDFEAFGKRFRMDVHGAQDDNELDLEDLPPGSTLEMCALLGKLREPGYELASRGRSDIWMKLPLLATCRLLQLVLDAERRLAGLSQQTEE